jgi:hypothetical protein
MNDITLTITPMRIVGASQKSEDEAWNFFEEAIEALFNKALPQTHVEIEIDKDDNTYYTPILTWQAIQPDTIQKDNEND